MYDLIDKAKKYIPIDNIPIIEEALNFASNAHHGQKRLSGEPFIEHPIKTAMFLADLNLDAPTLTAAILHDVIEDCDVDISEIKNRFGSDVSALVDGVTKLSKIETLNNEHVRSNNYDNGQSENIRKMLVAMAKDIRVVLIKLADRLHNMQTLHAHEEAKRKIIAQETLEIYAPLAHRLGMWDIKWQLEDLSFEHVAPNDYKNMADLVASKREERERFITDKCNIISRKLNEAGINAEVSGRPKHLYSIHKKIEKYISQGKEFSQIYDLLAIRILVKDLQECYSALGVVHSIWHPIPGEFDDYIANPKQNYYMSLHTTTMMDGKTPLEIQIRSHDMHQVSEYGVAAHWKYKGNQTKDMVFEEKMSWMRQLLEWQREVSGSDEFMESVKTDIFQDQVFVYSPRGDVLALPATSTPIDFAYHVHTDLGHRCIGAKVNGKLVPLYTILNNGDTVEIIRNKTSRGPSLDWLNTNLGYANTANARSKIRYWFRRQERDANIQRGKDILSKEIRRLSIKMDEEEITKLLRFDSSLDLLLSLGNGSLSSYQLATRLTSNDIKTVEEVTENPIITWPSSGIEVLGVGDLLTRVSQCCSPIPGDKISGYITRGRGVSVHKSNCSNITNETEKERIIEVGWANNVKRYPVRLRIEAWDRVGLLRDITNIVSQEKINIASVTTTEHEYSSCSIYLTIHTEGVSQLSRLFSRLEAVEAVYSVTRSNSRGESSENKKVSTG
ncbi:MAG: bifunctional (p)ppGpp synthetase/guanosine-3',5'-bis(diphosphate) 3'-pyrophosphohydrolase [SAR202 cluster bacterium]|nr:bifunctional (p)ppGpp synthetase/guanosine-3',5'-bis(diphosphate) 3'-pyrophosphohydrolase [SAR202 cluster bacterium]|tara:strand:+ start:3986 stop:6169 length:2184 start_codon:yes stop_codon:yes gene_type:complete